MPRSEPGHGSAVTLPTCCRIHDHGFPGGPATNGHGLYISRSDTLFQNNDVFNNHGYGFHIYNDTCSRADPWKTATAQASWCSALLSKRRFEGSAAG
jgi:hypothetical protein